MMPSWPGVCGRFRKRLRRSSLARYRAGLLRAGCAPRRTFWGRRSNSLTATLAAGGACPLRLFEARCLPRLGVHFIIGQDSNVVALAGRLAVPP